MDSDNELSNHVTKTPSQAINQELIGALIIWGIAAFAFAFLGTIFNKSPQVLGASFIMKSFSVLLGTGLGVIGALLGRAINQFVRPDFIQTQGGFFQILWVKLF
ncbi:hypothetical protein DKL61_09595 [Gammaproteobacteria bacterium ESL0073]|nr:hypothetical protein DKL61_09595 [Gammaproteobacteria bacterium ESL0073]